VDSYRTKKASEWYYTHVFRDEALPRRQEAAPEKLPALLQAARSIEAGIPGTYQSRESVFLKQAKLLAGYEDDCPFTGNVVRYFPTYQSLTDRELRGYFTWRTKLRKGEVEKTSLSFAFLYIYELINGVGVDSPEEGYRKLKDFAERYGALDDHILPYLDQWLRDYVIYHRMDPNLLADTKQAVYDRCITVLAHVEAQPAAKVMHAVKTLAPRWLERSKFYGEYTEDCDEIIVRSLRRISAHYDTRCKKGMVEQFFGEKKEYQTNLFTSAVFCDRSRETFAYILDEQCVYRCRGGLWTVEKYSLSTRAEKRINDLMKTMDAVIREVYDYRNKIKIETETKWMLKLIREEAGKYLEEKKQAEAKKITIDFTRLDKIRNDADMTREKLTVEEEEWDTTEYADMPGIATPVCAPARNDTGLADAEYRLVQCLLYGRDTGWVQKEGLMLSVLVDGINEKLYDTFLDTVLDDSPAIIEDYIDELKEMVTP